MAKKWVKFPYADKAYDFDAAALKKHWARLHRGDCEPFPKDADVLERVADLATNVGEDVVFLVEGKSIKHHSEDRGESRSSRNLVPE